MSLNNHFRQRLTALRSGDLYGNDINVATILQQKLKLKIKYINSPFCKTDVM